MRIHNQAIYDAVVEKCKDIPAEPFTNVLKLEGVDYCYMSEVDPHRDAPINDESVWNIKFLAAKPDYFFIYHFEGQQFCVEPELNKAYPFNFTELHAFLHKDNVAYFDDEDMWQNTQPDEELACVFVLV